MKILGIDFGTRRIGVAVWDDPQVPARPLETLRVTESDAIEKLRALCERERPDELVIGLPLLMSGREGAAARNVRIAAERLRRSTGLPMSLQDERLTTSQAHTHRVLAGATGKRKMRAGVDAHAAAIVLQAFVDTRTASWRRDDDG